MTILSTSSSISITVVSSPSPSPPRSSLQAPRWAIRRRADRGEAQPSGVVRHPNPDHAHCSRSRRYSGRGGSTRAHCFRTSPVKNRNICIHIIWGSHFKKKIKAQFRLHSSSIESVPVTMHRGWVFNMYVHMYMYVYIEMGVSIRQLIHKEQFI